MSKKFKIGVQIHAKDVNFLKDASMNSFSFLIYGQNGEQRSVFYTFSKRLTLVNN